MTSSLSPVHHQCVHVHATLKPADDVFGGGWLGVFFWGSAARCLGGWAATLAGGHGSPAPTSHYSQRRRRVTSQTPADLLLARTRGGGQDVKWLASVVKRDRGASLSADTWKEKIIYKAGDQCGTSDNCGTYYTDSEA